MCKTTSFLGQVGINMHNMVSLNNCGMTMGSTKNANTINCNSGQNCGNNQMANNQMQNYKNMKTDAMKL